MEALKCICCFGLIGHMVLLGDIQTCFPLLQCNHHHLVQFKERLFWGGKESLERKVFWECREGRGCKEEEEKIYLSMLDLEVDFEILKKQGYFSSFLGL